MKKTNILVFGSLMACVSTIFQILPIFLTEAFVIFTLFSAVPIYIISRLSPKIGFLSIGVSFLLVSFFSIHEALLFIFTNGPVGFSLGCFSYYIQRKVVVVLISALILACSLCILNFLIGIPVLGTNLPGTKALQILIFFIFSIIYCFLFLKLCNSLSDRVKIFNT